MARIINGWIVEKVESMKKLEKLTQQTKDDGKYYELGYYEKDWDVFADNKRGNKYFNTKDEEIWYISKKISVYGRDSFVIRVKPDGSWVSEKAYCSSKKIKEDIYKYVPKDVLDIVLGTDTSSKKPTEKELEHQRRRKISKEYQDANKDNYRYYEGPKKTQEEMIKKRRIVEMYNKLASEELTNKLKTSVKVQFIIKDETYNFLVYVEEMKVSIKGKDLMFKSEAPNLDGKPVLSTSEKNILFNSLDKNREEYNKVYNEISSTLQKYRMEVSKKLLHDKKMNKGRTKFRSDFGSYNNTKGRLKYSAITENYFPY